MPVVPPALFRIGRFNHVAIAVPELAKATSMYRDVLGASTSAPKDIPEHGVTVVFVEFDNTKIELIHPLGDKSPISSFLAKKPSGGIHHICLEVDSLKNAVKGLAPIKPLGPSKIGAHGKPVVFLSPKDFDGVLIELEEA